MKVLRLSLLAFVILLMGCACAQAGSEKERQELASALTKVASAVESTVHIKKQGAGLRDMELLELATRHDSDLLAPFRTFVMKAEQNGDHAIVMVCTKDGITALLEDASCTRGAEPFPSELHPKSPCVIDPELIGKLCPPRPLK